jgi:hypothetical protein
MSDWRRVYTYVLGSTNIELHPQYGSEYWYVVDTKGKSDTCLTPELPLKQAKLAAEREAKRLGRS